MKGKGAKKLLNFQQHLHLKHPEVCNTTQNPPTFMYSVWLGLPNVIKYETGSAWNAAPSHAGQPRIIACGVPHLGSKLLGPYEGMSFLRSNASDNPLLWVNVRLQHHSETKDDKWSHHFYIKFALLVWLPAITINHFNMVTHHAILSVLWLIIRLIRCILIKLTSSKAS